MAHMGFRLFVTAAVFLGFLVAAARPVASGATPEPDAFAGKVSVLDEPTRGLMRWSWHPGCPVPIEELRLLTLDYWGFDGQKHVGQMIVHADVAEPVLGAFERLFRARYPIQRIELVDQYEADDERSMGANNTSAFNCREVAGRPGVWSQHAYGRAIDLNPLQNPYTSGSTVSPAEARRYVD